jgi:putative endonuclease
MAYYVYIVESLQDGTFYKGYSEDPLKRLQQHNQGESKYTSGKMPWKLVYVEECASKTEALIRERNLKKADRSRIQTLLVHPKNRVGRFTVG